MSSIDFKPITLERVLEKRNMYTALCKVESNKGGAGVDNIKTTQLRQYI